MRLSNGARSLTWRIVPAVAGAGLLAVIAGCWIKNIETPYYTQETSYWCGAASAQMVLKSEKINKYVDQDVLYNYIHSHNICGGWASEPQGLADGLNHYTPPGFLFAVSALANQDDGVKKAAHTIDQYGVPPISLIYGCGHWVVVRGVFTDVQPTTASSYTVYGFWVNDPWYGSTSLGDNQYVSASDWKSTYFTGCNWCGATGTRYISVVDPQPPPAVNVLYPQLRPRLPRMLEPAEILRLAAERRRDLEAQAPDRERFAEVREAIAGTEMVEPLLVRRSDREGDAFYIVPMNRAGLTAGAIRMDGYSGELLGFTYVRRPLRYLPDVDQRSARDLFERRLPTLPVRPGILRQLKLEQAAPGPEPVRPEALQPGFAAELLRPEFLRARRPPTFDKLGISLQDVRISRLELVWEPATESQNPYYPLWAVQGTVKQLERPQLLAYVSARGDVFSELTPTSVLKGGGSR